MTHPRHEHAVFSPRISSSTPRAKRFRTCRCTLKQHTYHTHNIKEHIYGARTPSILIPPPFYKIYIHSLIHSEIASQLSLPEVYGSIAQQLPVAVPHAGRLWGLGSEAAAPLRVPVTPRPLMRVLLLLAGSSRPEPVLPNPSHVHKRERELQGEKVA